MFWVFPISEKKSVNKKTGTFTVHVASVDMHVQCTLYLLEGKYVLGISHFFWLYYKFLGIRNQFLET